MEEIIVFSELVKTALTENNFLDFYDEHTMKELFLLKLESLQHNDRQRQLHHGGKDTGMAYLGLEIKNR